MACGNNNTTKNLVDDTPPKCTTPEAPETKPSNEPSPKCATPEPPESKTSSCNEEVVPETKEKKAKGGVESANPSPNGCTSCGAAVFGPGKKCNCGKPPPPTETSGCKKNQGGLCRPNTSCEVIPLIFEDEKEEISDDIAK